MIRSLIGYDVSKPRTIRELMIERECKIKKPFFVENSTKIGSILKTFKLGYSHLAIVCSDPRFMHIQTNLIMNTIKHREIVSDQMVKLIADTN